MIIIGNVLGVILQPLYYTLFFTFTKNLKERRILLYLLIAISYISTQYFWNFNNTVNGDLFFLIMIYVNLKFLYREKARITDVFIYILAFLLMGIIAVTLILSIGYNIYAVILMSITSVCSLFILKNKLHKIEKFYNKFWNRHEIKNIIKSVTIRGFSIVMINITFVILHIWLMYLLMK